LVSSAPSQARLPNPDHVLRPGLFARVTLVLNEREGAIQIPEQALVPQGQDQFVFKVADGKAAFTKVTTGIRREGMVEITEGLGPEDEVVTAGQLKIRDGAAVQPVPAAEA
jgi:membrane fusion protein (multidrug efflux system)